MKKETKETMNEKKKKHERKVGRVFRAKIGISPKNKDESSGGMHVPRNRLIENPDA